MRTYIPRAALALLIGFFPCPCFALMELEQVTPARAKELGLEIHAVAAGPKDVRVELEFATAGALKSFHRVELEVSDGGTRLVTSALGEERRAGDRVSVSFVADRSALGKLTLRVVAIPQPRGAIGYELRVADFVEGGLSESKGQRGK